METSKNFYRHRNTGEGFVIETDWQGRIIASCAIEGPLQPDAYALTTDRNAELEAINDKLILVGPARTTQATE